MEKTIIKLYNLEGPALILEEESGFIYLNQTRGVACYSSQLEGKLVILPKTKAEVFNKDFWYLGVYGIGGPHLKENENRHNPEFLKRLKNCLARERQFLKDMDDCGAREAARATVQVKRWWQSPQVGFEEIQEKLQKECSRLNGLIGEIQEIEVLPMPITQTLQYTNYSCPYGEAW